MRDPRNDPQRGDVLHQTVNRGPNWAAEVHRIEVLGCDGFQVHLRRSEGRGMFSREAWTTLDSWRLAMAQAEEGR